LVRAKSSIFTYWSEVCAKCVGPNQVEHDIVGMCCLFGSVGVVVIVVCHLVFLLWITMVVERARVLRESQYHYEHMSNSIKMQGGLLLYICVHDNRYVVVVE